MLIVVGIALFYYILQSFFTAYHLIRFGIGPRPKAMALIFIMGSVILLALAIVSWINIDIYPLGNWFNGTWRII